jgi:carboxypeptidase T
MQPVTRTPRRRSALAAIVLNGLLIVGVATTGLAPSAAAADFPAVDSLYHSYDEMVAEIHAAEAAYPTIVDVFAIGQSYEGRAIWAARISDNAATDEPEPEILFDSLHHGREHMTVEQALYLLWLLTHDYGVDPQVTSIVDHREILIVFAVNPDGGEYDLTGPANGPRGPYRAWRKNRQPNPGSSYVGTDPNRNYDYRWACCGGSSGTRSSSTYRGPAPFSAPETQVLRDFVRSRVVNGRQQITAHITFHTNGELILWPYGYTKTNVPVDMTTTDWRAFVAYARGQARRNGYRAIQSSDLYITDGDQIDWMYGRHRIFSFTWELYPPESGTVWGDHYPADERIAAQTARNRAALLYFMQAGWCPYTVLGATIRRTHCGPFDDDFEIGRGWTVNPDGTDTATKGAWRRGDPAAITIGGLRKQLGTVTSGRYALITGPALEGGASRNDLDGGTTTIRSTTVNLPATPGNLTFRWFLGTHYASSAADAFRAWVEGPDGTRMLVLQRLGAAGGRTAAWGTARVPLTAWAGQSIRIVFAATDGGPDNFVDAGVDDVRIERP